MSTDLTRAAVARLLDELGPGTCPDVVGAAVHQACEDLRGSPVGALPELVERLARVRLLPA
ncbi:three-helix bundle dimerization domain-containing protein [Pseudonocardia phyllosphaerae]|uniref:three-helix bundle dimerization domain-containing protein n=1 Tax=Pseudonocardia phyllosphaerae TaxID=3390502 RepID=UPI00397E268D